MRAVCVVGLGRVGLPMATILANSGFNVVGFDKDPDLIAKLRSGDFLSDEPGLKEQLAIAIKSGNLILRTSPTHAEYFILCVSTDVRGGKPDVSEVFAAAEAIVPYIREGNVIIMESTCPPETTRLVADLIGSKRPDMKRIFVAHCPERLLPGRALEELVNNDRTIGGFDDVSAQKAADLYSSFVKGEIHLTDDKTAEVVKLVENTFRDVNIALANELAKICESHGVNVWKVIELANLHPRVNVHRPGPGVGGGCVPVVPYFLIDGLPRGSSIIRIAREINDAMPEYVAERIIDLLSEVSEPKVCLLGAAYKGDVSDVRRSPSLEVVRHLRDRATEDPVISVYDPYVRSLEFSSPSLDRAVKGSDLIVVLVDHKEFRRIEPKNMRSLVRRMMVFDTRNCIEHEKWRAAGFQVMLLGDGSSLRAH